MLFRRIDESGTVGALDSAGSGALLTTRDDFRQAMRTVAHSVTVVTTAGPAGAHGATVSAFSSVSADPPTVLVCLNASSRIAELVRANGVYAVNVLREGEQALAERFAGRTGPAGEAERFAGVELLEGSTLPLLAAAHTAFVCRLGEVITAGTHIICLGAVESVRVGSHRPLAYLDGAYVAVVSPLHPDA
jgi:flavin reductase (DIM6/NTAB) family NADH-FMN oxidoreductase RutF